jgi:trypsin
MFLCVIGTDATPGEYPHQAQLLRNGAHRCGGSLVHPCMVLTARHCVQGQDKDDLRIRLGEHDRSNTDTFMTEHLIVTIIEHPSIDVALLLITPSADLANIRIDTIALATANPPVGTMATVTGWGQTISMVGGSLANVLQEVTIPIGDPAICNSDLPGTVQAHEICAGTATGPYANACHGDSGGPLVVETSPGVYELVGVVSWGNGGCPTTHHYAVYVSVAVVRAWIIQHIPTSNPTAGSNCACIQPATRPNGSPVPATFDGANCYLGPARTGCQHDAEETKSFVYQNRHYIKSSAATQCPLGTFDSCNCYVRPSPAGGFISGNKFYQPLVGGSCPPGTSSDGTYCVQPAPWATTAFLYNGNFYTTARKQCAEPSQFSFDGANCLYMHIPGPNPFIWANAYYSDKSGGSCPAGSSWDTAHCYFRHAPWATSPFLWTNGRFYATPRRQCLEGSFDGANCLIMTPPPGANAFIYNNNYYYGWP